MDLSAIIEDFANRADDLLADAANRKEAEADLTEALAAQYPKLSPADRRKVVAGVLAILDEEGFFDTAPGGRWDDGPAGARDE
jgi:hypothetical protein